MNEYLIEVSTIIMNNDYVIDSEIIYRKITAKNIQDAWTISISKYETSYTSISGLTTISKCLKIYKEESINVL